MGAEHAADAVVGASVATYAAVGPPALAAQAVGFGTAGIKAGTLAAGLMSQAAIANGGGVAAGGWIAAAQSAGACATLLSPPTAVVAAIAGVYCWLRKKKKN